jgi:hypothetical protein
MDTDALKRSMLQNAREITRLQCRIHETFKLREKDGASYKAWEAACWEAHSKYNKLAFPGGSEGAVERILNGDSDSIEAALCFLELRPYFFRSGYMYQIFLRKMKRAALTQNQSERFKAVLARVEEWRRRKSLARNGA